MRPCKQCGSVKFVTYRGNFKKQCHECYKFDDLTDEDDQATIGNNRQKNKVIKNEGN